MSETISSIKKSPMPRNKIHMSNCRSNITDEMIQQYIQEQEGEPIVDDSRFEIDPN
jgi:hypothetical protein